MTKQEFDMFEKVTYELLSEYEDDIWIILHDNGGEMDLVDLKDAIQEMIDDDGLVLNEAFDGNVFNFISDDELAYWLQEHDICYTYESIRVGVREIDYAEGEAK